MKIAIIGSFGSSIPLREGQIHAPLLLSYDLARGLAKRGHQVTYFGRTGEGLEPYENLSLNNLNYKPMPEEYLSNAPNDVAVQCRLMYEQAQISKIFQLKETFDLYYNWAAFRISPLAAQVDKPVVVTHHDATNTDLYQALFNTYTSRNLFLIPISNYMRQRLKMNNTLATVYNGVETKQHIFEKPNNYFCWVGRVVPSKGLHIAIELAKKMNFNLKIAGPMAEKLTEFGELSEYIGKIKRAIDCSDNIEFLGSLSHDESNLLIAKSKGLIFPTNGEESLPTVVIEAITQGVPVISSNKGPMPEMVSNGKTGYLCAREEEYIDGIHKIDLINREKCKKVALLKFSLEKMVEGYEERFQEVINKK